MASRSRQKYNSSASSRSQRTSSGRVPSTSSTRASRSRVQAQSVRGGEQNTSAVAPRYLESKTVREIRKTTKVKQRSAMMQRAARAGRLPAMIIGIVAGVVIIALIVLFILSRTDAFQIEELSVEGTDHLTGKEVAALVSIPQGTTLLNVDEESIVDSLMRDAWVESVDVTRIFPDKLKITVHERKLGAIVEIPMGKTQTIQNWAIAKDGMWLMAIPSRDSEIGSQLSEQIYLDAQSALRITGVPYGIEPKIGTYCTDDNINNALSIISGMTTELADQVKTVTATDAESTLLTLDNNIEIAFGTADNIREKERICLEIMEQNPKVVYINVRVVDRPTWRSA